eukprot:comp19941_c1_seq1/m.24251 comp19941_c1_seq1/g.24251  ORF comp19941_c1_seq1/g.24251 comp19941_c1_seq1/m.24251 type:complete len:329 (+) comp19941_c1_seq1:577-1563(+)
MGEVLWLKSGCCVLRSTISSPLCDFLIRTPSCFKITWSKAFLFVSSSHLCSSLLAISSWVIPVRVLVSISPLSTFLQNTSFFLSLRLNSSALCLDLYLGPTVRSNASNRASSISPAIVGTSTSFPRSIPSRRMASASISCLLAVALKSSSSLPIASDPVRTTLALRLSRPLSCRDSSMRGFFPGILSVLCRLSTDPPTLGTLFLNSASISNLPDSSRGILFRCIPTPPLPSFPVCTGVFSPPGIEIPCVVPEGGSVDVGGFKVGGSVATTGATGAEPMVGWVGSVADGASFSLPDSEISLVGGGSIEEAEGVGVGAGSVAGGDSADTM